MPTTAEQSPLISATKLAARWRCHITTIGRKVRDGDIKPAARAGSQMSFAMSDVLRVEAGLMPKRGGLQKLTPGQRAALPPILSLLNLEGAELTPGECESICNVYFSVPYEHRKDGQLLAGYLELVMLSLRAICRAESFDTIGNSPALIGMVKDLSLTVQQLLPRSLRNDKEQ